MKKITKLLTIFCIAYYFISTNTSLNAAETYQFIIDLQTQENYNLILNSGYYLFINNSSEFTKEMIIGDADKECDFIDAGFEFDEYLDVDDEDIDMVDAMMNEYYDYFNVTLGERNCDVSVLFVRVYSYAVFDAKTSYFDHLEAFYAADGTINTDSTISGNKTHIINIDNPISLEEIKSRYTATDAVDGDITDKIVFISNYDEQSKPGTYYILLYVTDNANNTTYTADKILVKDFTNPVTSIEDDTVTIEVGTVFTFEDALELFTYTDNYTASEKLEKHIILDKYGNKYNTVGDYYIEAYCIDEGGNKSEAVGLNIKIVDTQKPNFHLIDNTNRIETYTELTNEEILSMLVISDNYYSLEELTITIENNSDGSQGKDFLINITVTDPSNNSCSKTIYYYIYDTEKPIINVSNAIYLEEGTELTNEQLLELLKEVGILSDDTLELAIIDTYNKDSITIFNYSATLANGSTINGSFMVNYYPNTNTNTVINYKLIILIISIILIVGNSSYAIIKKYY